MVGVIVDIGTGDGDFVYKLVQENPDRFVIGIDPSLSNLEKTSAKIYKKPSRGGLKNALFALSGVEDLPHELDGVANQVFINFPWGSLLKGIVLVDENVWENIKRICKKGAYIDILFGYDLSFEAKEIEKLELPRLSLSYIKETIGLKLSTLGLKLIDTKEVDSEELKNYPSSWAKKLRFRKGRNYYFMRVMVR